MLSLRPPALLVFVLVTAAACHSTPAPAASTPTDSTEVVAIAPRDSTETMTDGGAIEMPLVRRRVLVRDDSLWAEALRIHYNAIVMDGHIDTPTLMVEDGYRLGARHRAFESHVDLPRMFEGGLDAPFTSIYVARRYGEGPAATQHARDVIAEVKRQVATLPDSAEMAYSAADVRRITKSGRKAILMGLEGGHALQGSEEVLRELYGLGIRYVTLTHVNTNSWADASQTPPRWDGLNVKGERLVRAMNRLGILVDLSHAADATFFDALRVSSAPVILSHSSCRALVDAVRNVSDDMLRALARNGGVVMINFFDAMVNPHLTPDVFAAAYDSLGGRQGNLLNLWNTVYAIKRRRGLPGASVDDVVDHIDHAIQVAGIDHVALGSDFDGVFDLPAGLDDVTRLPWITYGLLKRGYSEEDLYKILGGNTLRVMEEVQRRAGTR